MKFTTQQRTGSEQKDRIITEVLSQLSIANPETFKAILMPAVDGPEINLLHDRGVPLKNMWAIERASKIWKQIRDRGLSITAEPANIEDAVPEILSNVDGNFDLAYLDFLGRPHPKHFKALERLLPRISGTIIITYVHTRMAASQRSFVKVVDDNPAKLLQVAAYGHVVLEDIYEEGYVSKGVKNRKCKTVWAKVKPR